MQKIAEVQDARYSTCGRASQRIYDIILFLPMQGGRQLFRQWQHLLFDHRSVLCAIHFQHQFQQNLSKTLSIILWRSSITATVGYRSKWFPLCPSTHGESISLGLLYKRMISSMLTPLKNADLWRERFSLSAVNAANAVELSAKASVHTPNISLSSVLWLLSKTWYIHTSLRTNR